MLIPLLTSPGTIARCQQQGLRYVVAWAPKDSIFQSPSDQLGHQNSNQRTQGQAVRYSTHTRVAQSPVLQSSRGPALFDLKNNHSTTTTSSIHSNSIRALSTEAASPTATASNVNNSTSTSGNGPKAGTFTATSPVRQRRPNYIRDFEVPADMSRLPPKFGDNQHIDIDEAMWQQLKSVVDTIHHKAPIRYAFAYGSGVFAQKGYDGKKKPMVDFIFGVSHPQHWHSLNLQANPHHYSLLGKLGSKAVAMTQERFGAGVYFNPFVEVNGMTIKYGVVSIDTLCNDLLNWDTMYLSGRLHKPVKILLDDPRTRLSNQVNLFNATRVALLSLPAKFTSEELFTKIAGLSYLGDFRMSIGENPHKVQNIVKAQLSQFHRLYDPLLANLNNVTTLREGHLEQDISPLVRSRTFQKLPPKLKQGTLYRYHSALSKAGVEIVKEEGQEIQSVATAPDLDKYLASTVHSIVQIPAFSQSVKGIATAGVIKTGKYGLEKLGKWWSRPK
ncbi:Mitochondrial translocator assembly and maintenance protein 41 [Linnemannia schmuckeri]|uniref:Phosphatidate cytidylyltransferase, mitochondrial n=1 Tax=Linnemannia schmuckeri TaxID=64567 RepID=A0A9P5V8G6_9FUNG|nr:Mitochondrial translocator assembly and maintenance protein 41 [Linnemannia schmuckeri]